MSAKILPMTRVCGTCRELAIAPGKTQCAMCEFLSEFPTVREGHRKPEAVVMVVPYDFAVWIAICVIVTLVIYTVCQLFV